MPSLTHALALATLCGAAMPAAAQQVETRVALSAGSATDALGTRSSAVSLAPGLVLRGTGAALALGGEGVRFGAGGWALGANAGVDLRAPLPGSLALTLGAAASGTTTSFDARFLSAQAIPALEAHWGPVQLYGGARAAVGGTVMRVASGAPSSGLPGLPGSGTSTTTNDVRTTRTLLGSVAGGGVAYGDARRSGYVGVREERGTIHSPGATDAALVDRSIAASLQAGPVTLAALAGTRRAPDERATFGTVSAAWSVLPAMALQAAAGRYPRNRLTGTLGGSFLSAGISLTARGGAAGGAAAEGAGRANAPAPAAAPRGIPGAPAPAPGTTRLAIRVPAASRVELAGDWNGWKPVTVLRASGGWWYADLALAPGRYRYGFRVNGSRWAVPDDADAMDDGFGGRSAWLVVR